MKIDRYLITIDPFQTAGVDKSEKGRWCKWEDVEKEIRSAFTIGFNAGRLKDINRDEAYNDFKEFPCGKIIE